MAPEEVRAWRERLDLSRPEFADALGVSVRTIEKWESGERGTENHGHMLEYALLYIEGKRKKRRKSA